MSVREMCKCLLPMAMRRMDVSFVIQKDEVIISCSSMDSWWSGSIVMISFFLAWCRDLWEGDLVFCGTVQWLMHISWLMRNREV